MIKYTPSTLEALEQLLKEAGYQLRSGKGAFNTGYCILQQNKTIVINRYHSVEARINSLIEIVPLLNINAELLSEKSKKYLQTIYNNYNINPSYTNNKNV